MHIVATVLKPGLSYRSLSTVIHHSQSFSGGLLLLGDGNCGTFRPDGTKLPEGGLSDDPTSSWLCRWLSEAVAIMQKVQLDKYGGDQLGLLVQDEPGLNLLERRAYFSCVLPELDLSTSEKPEEVERLDEIARLTRQNMLVRACSFTSAPRKLS